MALNVGQMISRLKRMTVTELRRECVKVFGERTRSHHKEHLLRRIAWRIQANEEGGLPERARQRAMEIATDADLRLRSPGRVTATDYEPQDDAGRTVVRTIDVSNDDRLPMPGALLTRTYKGRTIHVRVLPKGFDYEGTIYRSLTAVAKAVTGTHWNGYQFFGLPAPRKSKTGRQS